jgi:hypothetical protein
MTLLSHGKPSTPWAWGRALALAAACLPWPAQAQAHECPGPGAGATFNLRIDNDMFGGVGQDQGYSNGFLATWVSPNLARDLDDPCLPEAVRSLNKHLSWLRHSGQDEQNMVLGFGQVLFTPTDRTRTDLIAEDRPYAAALLFSVGYNARRDGTLHTAQLRLGIVGPSARGRQVQNGWHHIIGVDPFDGWDNQLRDEPVAQLLYEQRQRGLRHVTPSGWGWDATGHWGASLGNFATYANAGAELRWGYRLPDDLGTAPLRPAGENTTPLRAAGRSQGWAGHLFVAADARWVLRDISLDGNTFKSSHHVDKRALVADVGYGVAVTWDAWKFAFARYHRSREFRGQQEVPVYGSFTISRRF